MTDENAEIRATLQKAQNDGHFVFIPSPPIPQFKALFVPVLATIRLTPDDFYPVSGGKGCGMHHAAAMRLANMAGIDWVSDVGHVGRMDDTKNPDYCLVRATGRIRGLDGLYQELSASKQLNIAEKRKSMKKASAERECQRLRETMVERCESGAQVRVIRAILGLPASFKGGKQNHSGITRNFCIVRYILDPSRPDVQTIQLQALANAHAGIYGTTPPAIEGPPMPASLPMKDVTPKDEQVPGPTTTDVPTDKMDTSLVDFENTPPEEQVKTILVMIESKNYPHYVGDMDGQPPLEHWNQEGRTEYFNHIKNWEAA